FFAESLTFNMGFSNSIALAISDDGNTVIESGRNATNLFGRPTRVFDLNGCGGDTRTDTSKPDFDGCRSRLLRDDLTARYPGFVGMINPRFTDDGKAIRSAMQIQTDSTSKFYIGTLHIAGYDHPPPVKYLALVDSFSTGDGEFDDYFFVEGTNDTNPENNCP